MRKTLQAGGGMTSRRGGRREPTKQMDGRGWNTGDQRPVGNQYQTGSQPPVNQQSGQANSPFEEPEQAPELRDSRSENLYSRDVPFWNRVVDSQQPVTGNAPRSADYWNHPDVMKSDRMLRFGKERPRERFRRFLGSKTSLWVLLGVFVIVLGWFLYDWCNQVRVIKVVGNVTIPAETIVRLSGIQIGDDGWNIDEEAVMRKVESNFCLRCTLVDSRLDTVTIHVREREPAAYINHNGMLITLDNRGFVLEETLNSAKVRPGLVKVSGLEVRRLARGQKITLVSTDQLNTYTKILVELEAMKGLALLSELDMSSMDSIYLATTDGYVVRLGNEEKIHEKLRAFLIVREKLAQMADTRGKKGTIDVADPAQPTFLSEEAAKKAEEEAKKAN